MAVSDQKITNAYALYRGDCVEVMKSIGDKSVHLSIYSPPFGGLFHYSSSPRDLSNSRDRGEFFDHYDFVLEQIYRTAIPGRFTAVHCSDISTPDGLEDFSGEIIRHHESIGFKYHSRFHVWKEPFRVRMRTMAKGLAHQTVVDDTADFSLAHADYLLIFRRPGTNTVPISKPNGFVNYSGARQPPSDVLPYRGYEGKQTENKFSQWVWRQYASCFWDDVRPDNVLPFRPAKDPDDERHVHPLQLDIIERAVTMWSNAGETVLTPFMGVGSEVFGAVRNSRLGVGIELKQSYYKQAVRNMAAVGNKVDGNQYTLDGSPEGVKSFGDIRIVPEIVNR